MIDNDNVMFKCIGKWKIVGNSGRHALIMDTKTRMNEFLLWRILFPALMAK